MSSRQLLGYAALTLVAILLAGLFGIALRIITQETSSPSEVKTTAPYYVVKRGDALATISHKTGIPVERLEELNPTVDPLALAPGERIRLRPGTPAERARARRRRKALPTHYVIKRGDSPSRIAEKTGVSLDRLFALNRGLEGRTLHPGQRLRLRR
ncbi:MAG: LysM peptidoglycan-binding domain-containing protein [Actinomycetota bacterium]|nr:LysM peptidoglycan-binding domain-containing protein [Actinomycetota bacterium]